MSGFPTIKILNQEYALNAKALIGTSPKNDLTRKVRKMGNQSIVQKVLKKEKKLNQFLEKKQKFDELNKNKTKFKSIVSVYLTTNKDFSIKNTKGQNNEEYYKWQFSYALINSGLYKKDFVGAEVYFPKGNKDSKPIKMEGAIFDSEEWFDYYKRFHEEKKQEALDWLRQHLIGVGFAS